MFYMFEVYHLIYSIELDLHLRESMTLPREILSVIFAQTIEEVKIFAQISFRPRDISTPDVEKFVDIAIL